MGKRWVLIKKIVIVVGAALLVAAVYLWVFVYFYRNIVINFSMTDKLQGKTDYRVGIKLALPDKYSDAVAV